MTERPEDVVLCLLLRICCAAWALIRLAAVSTPENNFLKPIAFTTNSMTVKPQESSAVRSAASNSFFSMCVLDAVGGFKAKEKMFRIVTAAIPMSHAKLMRRPAKIILHPCQQGIGREKRADCGRAQCTRPETQRPVFIATVVCCPRFCTVFQANKGESERMCLGQQPGPPAPTMPALQRPQGARPG